jgi:hypothetical protein
MMNLNKNFAAISSKLSRRIDHTIPLIEISIAASVTNSRRAIADIGASQVRVVWR